MKIKAKKLLAYLVILITFISTNQWSDIPLGNTTVIWIIDFMCIVAIFWNKKLYFHPQNKRDYYILRIYFFWMLIGVVRGVFMAIFINNYWIWKQLITGSLALSLPLFVYVFSTPDILKETLRKWLRIALPLFALFFFWEISSDAYHFYLGPVLLLACFLPIIPSKKWRIVFILLLLLMIFADFSARSQVLKALAALLMSLAYISVRFLSDRILRWTHLFFCVLPIILLFLGITGTFNIFEGLNQEGANNGITKELASHSSDAKGIAADTRTFIYVEVIQSAIKHNYVLWGRTPARGNDSEVFGKYMDKVLHTGFHERFKNEVCFPNIFTWLGLIGMLFYCFIYLKSSYLAVYKSNNLFIKLVGVFIAFRFSYGWIEDFNNFDIMNISLWMMIAMGFSKQFRQMTDNEFKQWVKSIFIFPKLVK